jgi:hypothetical protein
VSKPARPGSEVNRGVSEPAGSKEPLREVALKLLPYVIGAVLIAAFIAAHLLLGLRPQH